MAKRRNYSPEFNARVALTPLSNKKTVAELSSEFGIHQNVTNNRRRSSRNLLRAFSLAILKGRMPKGKKLYDLHAKIG